SLNKREDAGGRILFWSRQRLGIDHRIRRGKTGPARSPVAVAIIRALIPAVAVIHGSGKNSLLFRAHAAHGPTRTSSWRTPSTAPFVFPSSCGGMSGSCIHIVLL